MASLTKYCCSAELINHAASSTELTYLEQKVPLPLCGASRTAPPSRAMCQTEAGGATCCRPIWRKARGAGIGIQHVRWTFQLIT
jgi:hypothetical protein